MPTTRHVARYGWIPQLPDLRDAQLQIQAVTDLPSSVDLSSSPDMPPVYDQGELGSCTANAIAAA
ncbi:MAG: peptidase, partial [Candidatus Dormibacteraeota bacterium]|nr:peptidase [Candidatus Dormibacteraeota bacterium]